jgi:hypothetical protein
MRILKFMFLLVVGTRDLIMIAFLPTASTSLKISSNLSQCGNK